MGILTKIVIVMKSWLQMILGGYEYWMLEDEFIEFKNENEMFPIF